MVKYLHESIPGAIAAGDGSDQRPLHDACAFGLSMDIISYLMDQYPTGVQVNRSGFPLHHLLRNYQCRLYRKDDESPNLSSSDVEMIIDAYPEALNFATEEGTALHLIMDIFQNIDVDFVKRTAARGPGALRMSGEHFETPLYVLIRRGRHKPTFAELIHAFIDIDPSIVRLPDELGYLPIHTLCKHGTWSDDQFTTCISIL